jgi:uncharacterized protein YjbI with pentapeptide repeats
MNLSSISDLEKEKTGIAKLVLIKRFSEKGFIEDLFENDGCMLSAWESYSRYKKKTTSNEKLLSGENEFKWKHEDPDKVFIIWDDFESLNKLENKELPILNDRLKLIVENILILFPTLDKILEKNLYKESTKTLLATYSRSDRQLLETWRNFHIKWSSKTFFNKCPFLVESNPSFDSQTLCKAFISSTSNFIVSDSQDKEEEIEEDWPMVNGYTIKPYANLINANLSNANLNGMNLKGANLEGANLNGALLIKANLEDANLANAQLTQARLRGANLTQSTLVGANLKKAFLKYACLENANLEGANFERANLRITRMCGASLKSANFKDAILQVANIKEGNLENANFEGVDLDFSNLTGANFGGANLKKTSLKESEFTDEKIIEANNLKTAKLDKKTLNRLYEKKLLYKSFFQKIFS